MKKNIRVWLSAFMMMLALVFCGQTIQAAGNGTVYVTVEKFSIGQGYLVKPMTVKFTEGENYAQIFDRVMKTTGYTYERSGSMENGGGFFLNMINKADSGKINVPKCIQSMPDSVNWDGTNLQAPNNNSTNVNAPDLGTASYSVQGGWSFFVNGMDSGASMDSVAAKDGDVFRCQLTIYGFGADLGVDCSSWGGMKGLEYPDREQVTKKLAVMAEHTEYKENTVWVKAYEEAVAVVSNLDSTKEQIEAAQKNLPNAEEIAAWVKENEAKKEEAEKKANTPAKTTLKSVKNVKGKKAVLTWKKVKKATGYEIYRSSAKKKGYKKVADIKKTKTVTYKTGKLKKNKTFYFKVRTYRKVGTKVYYGEYSNVRKVTIK